jgi:hypothetical protein
MKTTIKNLLKHIVKELNGQNKLEKKALLESEIERLTILAGREEDNSEQYHRRMMDVHNAQSEYIMRYDKYHPVGLYQRLVRSYK